ncbi:DUF757-domain-containing protein [Atractiella rhizophila]|nr:DUF757-domain-containing protein [Atractiella rhizophila]KAH8923698.1 DUF757-domain-containing protein [Atractiella rhizophila]
MSIPANFDAANAPNHADIEKQFAVKCVEYAEVYEELLQKLPPHTLKLTRHDDEIYSALKEKFPEIAENRDGKLQTVDEEDMKSKEGKEKWRDFMKPFEKKVQDWNFGTLLKKDCKAGFTETNTIFVLRLQFLAFEIARNRTGLNDRSPSTAS